MGDAIADDEGALDLQELIDDLEGGEFELAAGADRPDTLPAILHDKLAGLRAALDQLT